MDRISVFGPPVASLESHHLLHSGPLAFLLPIISSFGFAMAPALAVCALDVCVRTLIVALHEGQSSLVEFVHDPRRSVRSEPEVNSHCIVVRFPRPRPNLDQTMAKEIRWPDRHLAETIQVDLASMRYILGGP